MHELHPWEIAGVSGGEGMFASAMADLPAFSAVAQEPPPSALGEFLSAVGTGAASGAAAGAITGAEFWGGEGAAAGALLGGIEGAISSGIGFFF